MKTFIDEIKKLSWQWWWHEKMLEKLFAAFLGENSIETKVAKDDKKTKNKRSKRFQVEIFYFEFVQDIGEGK